MIAVDVVKGTVVILGTQYAGEMKKALFTIINYQMLEKGILPMHCSATEGVKQKDTTLIFGRAGTGKTALAHDEKRLLIGDDEHCWTYARVTQ